MQKFRHDYINILLTMSEYIRSKDVEQLERYFNETIMPISQGMQSNNYKLGTLRNVKLQELKGILSFKLIKAQELKVDAVIEVVEPIEQVSMESVQLCRCLGIILDNAIEEAVQCEEPSIRVAVIKEEQSVLIVVTNSCRKNTPELYKIYEKGFSTKGMNRGLGLSNLKEIVAKSDSVTLDTQIDNGEFIQLLAAQAHYEICFRLHYDGESRYEARHIDWKLEDIIEYLRNNRVTGLYSLDVDLKEEKRGIALGAEIRQAMDYITKDKFTDIQKRIIDCIDTANTRYLMNKHNNRKIFQTKSGDKMISVDWRHPVFRNLSPVAQNHFARDQSTSRILRQAERYSRDGQPVLPLPQFLCLQ